MNADSPVVIKIKKDLIHKAKVKKSYAKLKAREPPVDKLIPVEEPGLESSTHAEPSQQLHPERRAMLDTAQEPVPSAQQKSRPHPEWNYSRKPAYFKKEIAFAEKQQAVAEERRLELEKRKKERDHKNAERERLRKAMAKARTGGPNGQRKLGRESKVLLERVKKIVGS